MRELAYFVGSLAGAAIMTALALVIRPEAPVWRFVLWGGTGVFVACACVVVLDYLRPSGNGWFLAATALGIALFVGFGTAFLFGPSFEAAKIEETPNVELLPETGQLRLYNYSPYQLALWGSKLAGTPAAIEPEARFISAKTGYYYFLTDNLTNFSLQFIGKDGEKLLPFEVYLATPSNKRFIAKFGLLIKMKAGDMTVHTQQFGVSEHGW